MKDMKEKGIDPAVEFEAAVILGEPAGIEFRINLGQVMRHLR